MSEAALVEAVVAAVNGQLPAAVRAYALGDLPQSLPDTYVETSVHRRFIADTVREDGSLSHYGYRILTRRLAKKAPNAYELSSRLNTALDFATLTVDGHEVVVEFETSDLPAPDDGWFSAADYWTCRLPITNPK